MTVIAARHYAKGRAVGDVDLADISPCVDKAEGSFCWIGLHEATPAEMAPIAAAFALHPLAVEDALDPRHQAKLDQYDDYVFLICRAIHLEGGRIVHSNTAIFIGRHFIITVRHGPSRDHVPVRRQLEAAPDRLAKGPDQVLYALLDYIIGGTMPVIDMVEEEVLALEERALAETITRDDTARLFLIRRDLFRLLRTEGAMDELVGRLRNPSSPVIDADMLPYFRDLSDQVRRTAARASDLRETINGAVETTAMLAQQRQGDVTKQLAAWAAILAVPTAIAGIYGMNFAHMPELHSRFGYPAVLLLMATICGWLYVKFRRSGWL